MEIMELLDQAEDEITKLSSLGDLMTLARFEGLLKESSDGVYLIMRDGLWRLREILSTIQAKMPKQPS